MERYWYANRQQIRPGCDTDRAPERVQRNLVRTDRLRLDVAVGSGQEMFSWHGQKSFQTEDVDELVPAGPISSGHYFSFLSSIFLEGMAKIDFHNVRNDNGSQVAVFGYTVPISESGFETHTDSGLEVMGYHGEFTVDLATKELKQLQVLTDDMPQSARVCSFDLTTRYESQPLNGVPFELPESVEMTVLHESHEITRTVTQYSQCHEFAAESVLTFGASSATSAPAKPKALRTLPPALPVNIRIKSQVDLETAWAGDPVMGELSQDVIDSQSKVWAPAGTAVEGLFLRVENTRRPANSFSVALQFKEMRVAGEDYILNLKSVMEPTPDFRGELPRRLQLENPPISDDPKACRFRLNDKQVPLKGVVTFWVTR